MIVEHDFTNRRPSLAQIRKQVQLALKQGADFITISWGENQITLEHYPYPQGALWVGQGWIGRHGGDDIAQAMNKGELS